MSAYGSSLLILAPLIFEPGHALKHITVHLQAAFLALVASKQLRAGGDAAYAAQLFNWAKYQVRLQRISGPLRS